MREGIESLAAAAGDVSVVCLPDLFLDHFVEVPDWAQASKRVEEAVERGGGNLLDTPQALHPGGNAANTAWALARLGAHVRLAGVTSARVLSLFEATLGRDGVDLSLVDAGGEASLTTVLSVGDPPANAMMNEPGSLTELGPTDLREEAADAIGEADAVLVANWASMREHGTQLVQRVVGLARGAGTFSYVDAADPAERSQSERDGLVQALGETTPDAWAMSDDESLAFSSEQGPREAGRVLAKATGASVDVHTHETARTHGDVEAETDAFTVDHVHRTTGAGDAFNAGNLVGYLAGAEPDQRLRFAHAVAGCYVSREQRRPPTGEEIARFAAQGSGDATSA